MLCFEVENWANLRMTDLQAGRYPNGEHTDIDCCDERGRPNHYHSSTLSVGNDDANTVDNDLQQQLDLDTPPEQDGEVEGEAWLAISRACQIVAVGYVLGLMNLCRCR